MPSEILKKPVHTKQNTARRFLRRNALPTT